MKFENNKKQQLLERVLEHNHNSADERYRLLKLLELFIDIDQSMKTKNEKAD